MARTGRCNVKQYKVALVSSGRLANSLRAPRKEKVSGRVQTAVDAGYSLYSTDSEDQVTTIHKGLDRCAALLNGMLQMEKTDVRRPCTKRGKLVPSKPTSKFGKGDARKKKPIKKTDSVSQVPKTREPQNSSVFNGRLTTSTPTTIPEKSNNSPCSQPSLYSVDAGVQVQPDQDQQPGRATPAPVLMTCAHLALVPSNQYEGEDPGSRHPAPPTDEVSEFSRVSTNEEDKTDSVDLIPVTDTSCQTSFEKPVPYHRVKNMSHHEAAKKVLTVKNLLGELKAIVADQIDCVALISEVEESISMLPAMVGSTTIQAEVAQALQPLRNENAQLRRRLRILNQQLMERERAEKEARGVDCDFEMVSVQMLNQSLQSQLNEMKQDIKALQKENWKLQQRNHQLLQLTEERAGELQQIRQQAKLDNSVRLDMDDTTSENKRCQPALDASEKENPSLFLGLQQREVVDNRLQQVSRALSRATSEQPFEKNGPELTSILDMFQHPEEVCPSSPISDTINKFLNSLEASRDNSSPGAICCSVGDAPHSDWNGKEVPRLTEDRFSFPKRQVIPSEAEKDFGFALDREPQKGMTVYVPLKETQPSADVRRLSPFGSQSHGLSPERSNKTQDGQGETKGVAQSFERLHIAEAPSVHTPVFDDLTGSLPAKVDMTYLSKSIGKNVPPNAPLPYEDNRMHRGRLSMCDKTFSSCDIKSVASNWSTSSWSSFNTLDEQDFRNGLAALDASIASLQRTIQSDLNR